MHSIRLICLDGLKVMEGTHEHFPTAIIFANRVFVFALEIGNVKHYLEVSAERIRYVDALASNLSAKKETE